MWCAKKKYNKNKKKKEVSHSEKKGLCHVMKKEKKKDYCFRER